MKKYLPLAILIIGVTAMVAYWLLSRNDSGQVKAPHFVDSTPMHGEVYAAQPINVTVNFNFDLAENSSLKVTGGGQDWTAGPATIEDAQTALKADLKTGLPDGSYLVQYQACWPDKSCHEGRLHFQIDSAKTVDYKDMRGQKQITVRMSNLAFAEPKILISPLTEVTWINDDEAGHFVNTETHPEHTYFPAQNSREILKGGDFKVTFELKGQYNYHCSAHYPHMVASLLVGD